MTMESVIIDLGCGDNKIEGAIGVDVRPGPGVDVVCDLERGLPFKSGCAHIVSASHILEHMRDMIGLMEEIFRICRPNAVVEIVAPYYTSQGAFRDPTHLRYLSEDTFLYFEPPTGYGIRTHFRIEKIRFGTRRPFRYFPEFIQKRCRRFLWNVVDNLYVTLRAVKDAELP